MKAIINELYANGVDESRVIYIPLDRRGFKYIGTAEQLEEKIESFITDDGFYYLFIDEVQNVQGFESVVQAYAEEGYSVFLTGSNSYLLSDDISTKLTGRYLNFETYTLDFNEYIQMKEFFKLNVNDNLSEEFKEFILNGGFPKSLDYLKNPNFGSEELKMLYSSQLIRDLNATPDADHNYPLVHVTDNMCENYLSLVDLADCVEVYDWGLWVMIRDEVTTYYNQGKSIEEVADALYSRLLVYAQENYG